jgi:hypothetical protein
MTNSPTIEELLAEARYQRHRYDLYRAKTYGLRPTTLKRLRELERAVRTAEARLRRAQQQGAPHNRD